MNTTGIKKIALPAALEKDGPLPLCRRGSPDGRKEGAGKENHSCEKDDK